MSPTKLSLLRSPAHHSTNRPMKVVLSTTTHSLAMRLRAKTTLSSWVGLPICMEKIFWVFANLVSPPSSEYRVFPSRRSFYDQKEREWALEALCRAWNHCLFLPVVYSPVAPVYLAEASQRNLHHPSHRHLHSSYSSQRGWKTKLLDFYALSTRLVSMPSHNLKLLSPNPHSPPRTVPQRPEILRHLNLHRLSQGSCCNHLSHFQHYHNRLSSNLHSPSHHQSLLFRTMCQIPPKRRWDLSGRSLVGNRRTLPRRRNPRRRKNLLCLGLGAAVPPAS